MHDVTQSCMGKRYIQNIRPIDFYTSEYEKFTDMASYFTLQLTFRKLLLIGF